MFFSKQKHETVFFRNYKKFDNSAFREALNNTSLKIGNLKTVYYGTESLTNLGAKIWNLLPNEYKELKSLSTFKSRISNWVTDECPCRMCKNFVAKIGFI